MFRDISPGPMYERLAEIPQDVVGGQILTLASLEAQKEVSDEEPPSPPVLRIFNLQPERLEDEKGNDMRLPVGEVYLSEYDSGIYETLYPYLEDDEDSGLFKERELYMSQYKRVGDEPFAELDLKRKSVFEITIPISAIAGKSIFSFLFFILEEFTYGMVTLLFGILKFLFRHMTWFFESSFAGWFFLLTFNIPMIFLVTGLRIPQIPIIGDIVKGISGSELLSNAYSAVTSVSSFILFPLLMPARLVSSWLTGPSAPPSGDKQGANLFVFGGKDGDVLWLIKPLLNWEFNPGNYDGDEPDEDIINKQVNILFDYFIPDWDSPCELFYRCIKDTNPANEGKYDGVIFYRPRGILEFLWWLFPNPISQETQDTITEILEGTEYKCSNTSVDIPFLDPREDASGNPTNPLYNYFKNMFDMAEEILNGAGTGFTNLLVREGWISTRDKDNEQIFQIDNEGGIHPVETSDGDPKYLDLDDKLYGINIQSDYNPVKKLFFPYLFR